jgi:hypothetical protein
MSTEKGTILFDGLQAGSGISTSKIRHHQMVRPRINVLNYLYNLNS